MTNKKYFRECSNNECNNQIGYTRKDSLKNAIRLNTKCMKCIRKERGVVIEKFKNDDLFEEVLNSYYNLDKSLLDISKMVNISFETLNKLINFRGLPKLKRNIKYFNRKESYEKRFKTIYGISYKEYLETKPKFVKYKSKVKYYTKKTIREWGVFIGDLDKVGRGDGYHHVDHIVSIKDCFEYGVDPIITADIINLRVIPEKENLSKGSKSIFSPEILVKNVMEAEKCKIYI